MHQGLYFSRIFHPNHTVFKYAYNKPSGIRLSRNLNQYLIFMPLFAMMHSRMPYITICDSSSGESSASDHTHMHRHTERQARLYVYIHIIKNKIKIEKNRYSKEWSFQVSWLEKNYYSLYNLHARYFFVSTSYNFTCFYPSYDNLQEHQI